MAVAAPAPAAATIFSPIVSCALLLSAKSRCITLLETKTTEAGLGREHVERELLGKLQEPTL